MAWRTAKGGRQRTDDGPRAVVVGSRGSALARRTRLAAFICAPFFPRASRAAVWSARDGHPTHPTPLHTHTTPLPQQIKDRVQHARQAVSSPFLGALDSFLVYFAALIDYCDAQLSHGPHMAELAAFQPDLVIGDVVSPCALGLTSILWRGADGSRVPRVMFSSLPVLDPLLPGIMENVPNHVAMVPQMGTAFPPGCMTLPQRAVNALFYVGSIVVHRARVRPLYLSLGAKHNITVDTRFLHDSALILYNADWAVEAPRHLPPNVHFVGAMTPVPPSPLAAEWDALLGPRTGNHPGAVFASLGTLVTVSLDEYRAVADALSALAPTRVIWKLAAGDLPPGAQLSDVPVASNVHITPWAPQNDLLGDGRIVAFVTHGGLNSIHEAGFHGVPIVGVPVYGDQPDNVAKAVAGGWGLAVHLPRLKADGLAAAVRRASREPAFKTAALRVARRMAARRSPPATVAADWVEHAASLGQDAGYLKTRDHTLSWAAWAMLDVAAMYAVVLAAAAIIARACVRAVAALARSAAPRAAATAKPAPLTTRGGKRPPKPLPSAASAFAAATASVTDTDTAAAWGTAGRQQRTSSRLRVGAGRAAPMKRVGSSGSSSAAG